MTAEQKLPFLIDTKTLCFLCLQECSENSLNKLFSFKTLSRYLKINLEKTLGSSYSYPTILLCPDCYDEAQKFSRLYQLMELTKMLIDESLMKIHAKMAEGRESERRMGRYREILQTQSPNVGIGNVNQLEFVEGIQLEMITKCKSKTRKMVPIVRVRRWRERSGSPVSMTSFSCDDGDTDSIRSLSPEPVTMEKEPLILSSYSLLVDLTDDPEEETETSDVDVIQMDIEPEPDPGPYVSSEFNCDHCNKSFLDRKLVHDHIIGSHADRLFESCRHAALSPIQFRLAVERFLHETVHAKRPNNSNPMLKTSFCEFCDFPVPQAERFCLRRHLVDDHFKIIAERLIHFQKENLTHLKELKSEDMKEIINYIVKEVKITNVNRSRGKKNKMFECILCRKRMSGPDKRQDHLRMHGYCLIKCELCEETFVTNTNTRFHELRRHTDIILRSLNINDTTPPGGEGFKTTVFTILDRILCLEKIKKANCPLCPKNFKLASGTKMGWRRHLLTKHFEFTANEIIDAQFRNLGDDDDCVIYKCRHCAERFDDKARFRAHFSTHITKPTVFVGSGAKGNPARKCSKCGVFLASQRQLYQHRKSDECINNASLPEIKRKVENIIQTSRNSVSIAGKCKPSDKVKWDLCGTTMRRRSNLLHHLRSKRWQSLKSKD